MRQRAARFQTEIKLPEYAPAQPPEDEQKKAQRAARFGTEYTPAAPAGLMEIGVCACGARLGALPSYHAGHQETVRRSAVRCHDMWAEPAGGADSPTLLAGDEWPVRQPGDGARMQTCWRSARSATGTSRAARRPSTCTGWTA